MASSRSLTFSNFLISVEHRAFRYAQYALKNEESALDAVQNAMMKLAEKYADRPEEEWPLLFQRILQNAIKDSMRRLRVRNMWVSLFSSFSPSNKEEGGENSDPLELIESEDSLSFSTPHRHFEQSQTLKLIEEEIEKLPARQREAFLLRYWEEMDIAETAIVMGCSEGSVKTHCSRATRTLADALRKKGIVL